MHVHLDTVGGISGNMFVAALLDAWPELADALPAQLQRAGFADLVEIELQIKNDGVLNGRYFSVRPRNSDHHHEHDHKDADHEHRCYRDIRASLAQSCLAPAVKDTAQGIFAALAQAEAEVHGLAVDDVAFHEVGAWDSIADIVCAAYLIDAVGADSWSVSSLPLRRGQVQCAHGAMPVPAPAVTLLLNGFQFHDDGLSGERITPTGAAILRYLQPGQQQQRTQLRLAKTGFGFGSHTFAGLSNVLRVLAFAEQPQNELPWQPQRVLQINFEVDDQTPEDLAVGLDNLRAVNGVLDVYQFAVIGKKGRQSMSVQVLGDPACEADIIAACFKQTTTIGLRKQVIERAVLARSEFTLQSEGETFSVKRVLRPGREAGSGGSAQNTRSARGAGSTENAGSNFLPTAMEGASAENAGSNFLPTAKIAMDDVARSGDGYQSRERSRFAAQQSLDKAGK